MLSTPTSKATPRRKGTTMSINDLIILLENRLAFSHAQRVAAAQRGDVALVQQLDADMASTQATLDQLRTLV